MTDAYRILEDAISDVGHWRWWAEALPGLFQVEFGGVQLWTAPASPDRPPTGVVALRFVDPSLVVFLTENQAHDVELNWPQQLHDDQLEPISISHDRFTLTSESAIAAMVKDCALDFRVGNLQELEAGQAEVRLGFRAGPVGMVIRAKALVVLSSAGELSPDKIVEASTAWWAYWKEYWQRRDTENPLPKDYACEVTIPLKGE
ncbi:MAG TPA: hypothetical protein VNT75_20485 [Symbiobacteriaceae bacterium]|nr:hypothetical protein [Symbiobacteriaceae bacterium]